MIFRFRPLEGIKTFKKQVDRLANKFAPHNSTTVEFERRTNLKTSSCAALKLKKQIGRQVWFYVYSNREKQLAADSK